MEINKTGQNKPVPKKKKSGKSVFRKVNDFLHLWLGLISGIIIVIVSITGCIYAFEKEIRAVTQPYQFVQAEQKPYLPPSQLKAIAEKHQFGAKAGKGPGNSIAAVAYPGVGKAAIANYRSKETGYMMIYMNPYSGEILKVKALEKDFFRFILEGHFQLWMSREVGQQVICWAVGIFVILLISGIIMWWPKNLKKANRDKSFKIKWGASFKRVNYDLHNVLGFYVWTLAFILAVTGLYFGFKWVPKTIYWIASAGKTMPERRERLTSDSTIAFSAGYVKAAVSPEDKLWAQLTQEYGTKGNLQVSFAAKPSDAVNIYYNPAAEKGVYYKGQNRYFDQYTLKELKGKSYYNKPYEQNTVAEKLMRMNYDIHVGAILGIPGKIMMFFASFICASLPITGFIIWWGKKKKSKKKPAGKKRKDVLSKHHHEHPIEETVV